MDNSPLTTSIRVKVGYLTSIRAFWAILCCGIIVAGCSRIAGAPQPLPANLPNDAARREASTHGTERVVYRFMGGTDRSLPLAGLTTLGGVLYGTTAYGGASNNGTVFRVSPSGSEHVVYSFKGGADGVFPQATLIAVNGILYGTTSRGGAANRWDRLRD